MYKKKIVIGQSQVRISILTNFHDATLILLMHFKFLYIDDLISMIRLISKVFLKYL